MSRRPDAYTMNMDTNLYNDKIYLQSKEKAWGKPLTFYALSEGRAVARIHFFLVKQSNGKVEAISIPNSPFGSIEYDQTFSTEALIDFVKYIKHSLLAQHVDCIIIKDCIDAYRHNQSSVLIPTLDQEGFKQKESLINHHIEVDSNPLKHKMHKMERKRLRKCQQFGVKFKVEPLSSIAYYYQFLQECRQEKGWHLSLSYPDIVASLKAMPDRYRIYAVHDEGVCLAASLAVKVTDHILYDFYHDSKEAFKTLSPVVFLIDGIYQHCQKNNIGILDLGTSATVGLQQFKKHLGGIPSCKQTYSYCP